MSENSNRHQTIEKILVDYNIFFNTYSYFDSRLIINKNKNNYLIVLSGLHNDQYFHDFIVHLEIKENEIHFLHDNIDVKSRLLDTEIAPGSFVSHCRSRLFGTDFAINLEKIYELHKQFFIPETDPKLPKIKPDATAVELNELSKIESKYIGSAITLHPNISLDLLLKLFPIFPAEVFANRSFDRFMQSETNSLRTLYNVCPRIFEYDNLVLPDFFIEWALAQRDLRSYVAGSHKVPIRYIEELVNDDDCALIANLICRIGRPCTNNVPGNYPIPQYLTEKIENRYSYFKSICPNKDEYNFCMGICADIISSM